MYTSILPFRIVARLFDTFLFEKMKILYRVGLAIIKYKEKELLECKDLGKIMLELREFNDKRWADDDKFLKTAFEIKLSSKEILVIMIFTSL